MFTLSQRGRRLGGRSALGAILLTFCLTLLALPASAHDTLTDSDPAEGAVLQEVPGELRLTFSGEVSELGVQFMVTGPEGRDVVQGTPTVEGTLVTQDLAEELVNGDYEATWRVTSSDGHPISGTILFSIDAQSSGEDQPGDEQTATASEPDATSDPDATTTPTAAPTGNSTDDAAQTTGEATAGEVAPGTEPTELSTGMPFWGWLVAGLAAVGLVACGFLAFRRH